MPTPLRPPLPHAELAPTPDAALERWQDEGLVGLRDWYYRVAAVDTAGNVSAPTAVVKALNIPRGGRCSSRIMFRIPWGESRAKYKSKASAV